MKNGKIGSIEQIYRYIAVLKSCRKGFITNIFNFEKIHMFIKNSKVFFEYNEGSYLNLLCEENRHYRLFFCIVDLDKYQFSGMGNKVICDIFVMYEDETFNKILSSLYKCNFRKYACIERWQLCSCNIIPAVSSVGYVFDHEKKKEVVDILFDIFDEYTDELPLRCKIDTFLESKKFINAYEINGHRYIGSLIYSEKKKLATIDFYFVIESQRGKRLSYILHNYFYQLMAGKGKKIMSYIHDNNLASISVHQKYGYQKDFLKKYTFISEE